MEKQKVTPEMVMDWEAEGLIDAIGNELPVDDDFIAWYCGERIKTALKRLMTNRDREYALKDNIKCHYFNGSVPGLADDEILLPCSEIEYQFEDEDEMDNSGGDFTIHGDCAYLYVGYGLTIKVDCDGLEKAVAEYLESQK